MKIIVVDDEQNALENLQQKLQQIDEIAEVSCFLTPQEALDYAAQHPVDIAFLDIQMPGITGLTMAYQLKQHHIKTNIIFVTAHAQYALDAFELYASSYLLKPVSVEQLRAALQELRHPVCRPRAQIEIQCFSGFEVFVEGVPVHFKPKKAKELLAYLVDRRGSSVTPQQIATLFWETKPYDRSVRSQVQTLISHMMRILKENKLEHIVIKRWNSLAVDTSQFACDYYRFLSGDANAYTDEYMCDYSWAEMTNGWLAQMKQK